ncbi:MAG TPA: hypothetical protein VFW09_16895 [Solirubrobacteraceae bacterium]|nr:hypothetical protein [Solirubrobacteraceae bacterium]
MPEAKRPATTTAKSKSKTTKKASGSSAAKSTSKASAGKTTAATKAGAAGKGTGKAAAKGAGSKTASKSSASKGSHATGGSASESRSKRADGTRAGARRVKRAASSQSGVISIAEQLVRGSISPKDIVMLTHEHIQDTFDDAASRGRVTRKDANELVAELVRRGRSGGEEVRSELEDLLGRGRRQLGAATSRASRAQPVDRIVRGADRARRAAGVGSSFPISGYPEMNVSQVQARLKELSRPELRKVLSYERKHANRKSVVGAIEKQL